MLKRILLVFILITSLLLAACSDKKTPKTDETQNVGTVNNTADNVPITESTSNPAEKVKLIPLSGELYELEGSGYILKKPLAYQNKTLEIVDKRIDEINKLVIDNPNTKFFLYYSTPGNELSCFDWGTNKKQVDFYGHVRDKLNPNIKSDKLKISTVGDYKKYFYKYDHHWTSYGIDVGYNDAYNMLLANGVNVQPKMVVKDKIKLTDKFFGSRVRQIDTSNLSDDPFMVNNYENLLDYDFYYDNNNRGKWTNFNNSAKDEKYDYYGGYYGRFNLNISSSDPDKVKIITRLNNGINAVFIGDSFLQGVYEPLAQNFDTSYFVYYWPKFNLDEFIKTKNINVVFYLGTSAYLTSQDDNH